ncbi:hypothetical protein N5079_24355 [Planotetraspora sp. A-T 1434]|uniref:hypothetical protein n=1 Tax=Planotetraspora sp. A-T 1434 TaxID=2979219 RepID=UPI0021C1A073|nr:hypothetical protein [Planotetraspora sp. A-T 1434]MCT9933350.1 hypothetical protein [Planotetraspora sp. A-T 1434]
MTSVLITVRLPRDATLESAMRKLELAEDEVDGSYGLVPIDPDEGLYALRVSEETGRRIHAAAGDSTHYPGPYSNPRIEPYGPPS